MNWNEFQRQPSDVQLGLIWELISHNDQALSDQGIPIWMHVCKRKSWAALEPLLAHPTRALLNIRDEEGRGWLHWATYHSMPPSLAKLGLDMLDHTWKNPDKYGRVPFEIFPQPALAQAMAQRLWSEEPVVEHPFARWASQAKDMGHHDVARIWDFWAGVDKTG